MGTALIVGGSTGVGLETARQLLGKAYAAHVTGRDAGRLAKAAEEVPGVLTHRVDATDADAMGRLGAGIGPVDVLVLTATGRGGAGTVDSLDLAAVRSALDGKLFAHLTAVQALLPHLAEDASITFVSAASARAALPGTAGLAAVNGAIEAMVRPLAVELAPRRVNAVSPGVVDTEWWSAMPEPDRRAYFEATAAALPSRQVATADQVAETIVLVATNRNIAGTVLEADGGARLVSA